MVRHLDINYVFKHPFEKVTRAYFKKVMKSAGTKRRSQVTGHRSQVTGHRSLFYL